MAGIDCRVYTLRAGRRLLRQNPWAASRPGVLQIYTRFCTITQSLLYIQQEAIFCSSQISRRCARQTVAETQSCLLHVSNKFEIKLLSEETIIWLDGCAISALVRSLRTWCKGTGHTKYVDRVFNYASWQVFEYFDRRGDSIIMTHLCFKQTNERLSLCQFKCDSSSDGSFDVSWQ